MTSPPPQVHPRGFTIVEILIGIVLTGILMFFAYRMFAVNLQTGTKASRTSKSTLEVDRFLQAIHREYSNLAPIFNGSRSLPLARSTQLRSLLPNADCGVSGTSLFTDVGAPVVPLPGRTWADLNAQSDAAPINPSLPPVTENDAIRFAHFVAQSEAFLLERSGTTPTLTHGSEPVRIVVPADTPPDRKLRVGDFAVITDSQKSDLFRVTRIELSAAGHHLHHEASSSIWNVPFEYDFGFDAQTNEVLPGEVFVQRVRIVTYAYDPSTRMIYRDSHERDDGFGGSSFPATLSPSWAKQWSPVVQNVGGLRFEYLALPDVSASNRNEITPYRNPRAGFRILTAADGDGGTCGNQIGRPLFKRLRVSLVTDDKPRSVDVHVMNMEGRASGEEGSPPVQIAGLTPTPTPTRTPTPGGPTVTPSPTPTGPTPTPTPFSYSGGGGGD